MQRCSSLRCGGSFAARRAPVGCIMCARPHSKRMGPRLQLLARLPVLTLHVRLPACARASRVRVCRVLPGGCAFLCVVWLRVCARPLRESYPLGSCWIALFRLTASSSYLTAVLLAYLLYFSPDLSNPAEPSTDAHGRYQGSLQLPYGPYAGESIFYSSCPAEKSQDRRQTIWFWYSRTTLCKPRSILPIQYSS